MLKMIIIKRKSYSDNNRIHSKGNQSKQKVRHFLFMYYKLDKDILCVPKISTVVFTAYMISFSFIVHLISMLGHHRVGAPQIKFHAAVLHDIGDYTIGISPNLRHLILIGNFIFIDDTLYLELTIIEMGPTWY